MERSKSSLKPWLLCSLLFNSTVLAAEVRYGFDDLQALKQQESWEELVSHLKDIKPTERNEQWQSLAEVASIGYLEHVIKSEEAGNAIAQASSLVARFPTLKQSPTFNALFSEQMVKAFKPCIEYNIESCIEDYASLVSSIKIDSVTLKNQGLSVYQHVSKALAVPFFFELVKRDHQYCENSQIAYSFLYTLDLPKHRNFELAKSAALEHCGGVPLQGFENHIIESKPVRHSLCPDYLEKGYVSGVLKQVCAEK